MQADITMLGRFLSEGATTAGLGEADADKWVAYYRACQLFAFLPYQLLFSITQVLFPMLARAKADGDTDAVKRYVANGARLGAIACGMLVSVVAALPGPLIAFAYPAEYAENGSAALRVLALGQGAFAMLGIAMTVMTSLGREWRATAITSGAVLTVAIACFAFVPGATFGGVQLVRTATATSVALAVALVVAAATVKRMTGAFVPLATAARVGLGVAACAYGGQHLPKMGKLVTPVLAVGVVLAYLAVLVMTRELRAADLAPLKRIAGKR
jgi:stage V sporulation protein B